MSNQTESMCNPQTPIEITIKLTNGISIIGTLLNMGYFISLIFEKRNYTAFDFIRCRCICNFIVCFLGVFYTIVPDIDCVTDHAILRNILSILAPLRITHFASLISENLLILNRLAHLSNKTNSMFYNLSKKVSIYFHSLNNNFKITLFLSGQFKHMLFRLSVYIFSLFICLSNCETDRLANRNKRILDQD